MGKHVRGQHDGTMGEMFFQQFVYNLFSGLLLSACDAESGYKADEFVTASLPCKFRETENSDWEDGVFRIKPDAASTMWNGCDAFAMMELKPPKASGEGVLFDQEKCIAMLSSTLISFDRHEIDTSQMRLPFLIGKGYLACLFIVHLEGGDKKAHKTEKIPMVHMVDSQYDLRNDKSRARLFTILLELLHNVKRIICESKNIETYRTSLDLPNGRQRNTKNPFSTSNNGSSKRKRTGNSDRNTDTTASHKKTRSSDDENNEAKEDLAARAAKCGGLFNDIELPWPRPITFGEEDVSIFHQGKSPYYFIGKSSKNGGRCFLKIWREDDKGFHDAIDEIKYLQQAQDSDVKVAPLMTNELVNVTVDGIKFNVMATEYIESCAITSIDGLVNMALSLMRVVRQLHEKAGLLHCDIKPDNIRWDSWNQQAYLIDFGHAQMADRARHYHATKDFEAPEIREERLPHSYASDTFSVGATILWFCDDDNMKGMRLGENGLDGRMQDLRAIGELLSAPLGNRKTIREGIDMLEAIERKCTHNDRLSASCGKRPRLVDTIG